MKVEESVVYGSWVQGDLDSEEELEAYGLAHVNCSCKFLGVKFQGV